MDIDVRVCVCVCVCVLDGVMYIKVPVMGALKVCEWTKHLTGWLPYFSAYSASKLDMS